MARLLHINQKIEFGLGLYDIVAFHCWACGSKILITLIQAIDFVRLFIVNN